MNGKRSKRHIKGLQILIVVILWSGCESRHEPAVETPVAAPSYDVLNRQIATALSGTGREIRFTSLPILEEHARQVSQCVHLEVLEVNHSQLTDDQIRSLLSGLTELNQLKLTGAVDGGQLKLIADVTAKLRTLNLPDGKFSDSDLKALTSHPTLEFLRFHSPHVGDTGLQTIAQIPQLRFLHVINVPISDAGLEQLYSLRNLESFYLDGSHCTEDGLSKLVEARPDLHFHWNQLHLKSDPNAHQH